MPSTILLPALSPTMEVGTIARWLVKEGDSVKSGDVLAEIETDKAVMEIEAIDEGVIARIFVNAGSEEIPVRTPIALIALEGEDVGEVANVASGPPSPDVVDMTSAGAELSSSMRASIPDNTSPHSDSTHVPAGSTRVLASPLARRLAKIHDIDPGSLKGTGPRGRVVRRDVDAAIKEAALREEGESSPTTNTAKSTRVPLDGMRRTIARRLTLSKQTIPHFYLNTCCDVTALLEARKQCNRLADESSPIYMSPPPGKLSVNDFILKAWALALLKVPSANAIWDRDAILRFEQADIGVAIAVDGGLYTPVIRDAGKRSVRDISEVVRDFARRARERRLDPHEYAGGTTSVSNLGMFGVSGFSAVINPPQSTILAVGACEPRAVVEAGQIVVRTVMDVTLSCDHRVVDGALGAQLLQGFNAYIENPFTLSI